MQERLLYFSFAKGVVKELGTALFKVFVCYLAFIVPLFTVALLAMRMCIRIVPF